MQRQFDGQYAFLKALGDKPSREAVLRAFHDARDPENAFNAAVGEWCRLNPNASAKMGRAVVAAMISTEA
jgi:hypothetical protein